MWPLTNLMLELEQDLGRSETDVKKRLHQHCDQSETSVKEVAGSRASPDDRGLDRSQTEVKQVHTGLDTLEEKVNQALGRRGDESRRTASMGEADARNRLAEALHQRPVATGDRQPGDESIPPSVDVADPEGTDTLPVLPDAGASPGDRPRHSPSVSLSGDEVPQTFQLVLIDCPGIEKDCFSSVLMNKELIQSFVFVVDADKETGSENKTSYVQLMESISKVTDQQEATLSQRSALFLTNKWDKVRGENDRKAVRGLIRKRLKEAWPFMEPKHVFEMSGDKVLEDVNLHKETADVRNFQEKMIQFLKTVAYSAIEEHCLWLLTVLEVCNAIVGAGQKWSERMVTIRDVKETMTKCIGDGSALEDTVSKNEDKSLPAREAAYQTLKTSIERQKINMKSLTWTIDDICQAIADCEVCKTPPKSRGELLEYLQRGRITWGHIDLAICKRIQNAIPKSFDKAGIKRTCTKAVDTVYKREIGHVTDLERKLSALKGQGNDSDRLVDTMLAVVLPMVVSGAVRLSPIMFPFVFLAAPLAPVPLIAASLYEEYKSFKDESLQSELLRHPDKFMKSRTANIIDDFLDGKSKTNSLLFISIFGESKKREIVVRLGYLVQNFQHLLGVIDTKSAPADDTKGHLEERIVESLRFYAGKVMDHEIRNEDLTIYQQERMGGGGQGDVFAGTLSHNGETCDVAVKILTGRLVPNQNGLSFPHNVDVYRECLMMRELSRTTCEGRETMVQYYGSCYQDEGGDKFTLNLVMERCQSDLSTVIADTSEIGETEKVRIKTFAKLALQCAKGLRFVHSYNIVHRDVKPSNFLIKGDRVMISDVGCSKPVDQVVTVRKGTIAYWAPEIAKTGSLHDKNSDIYSLGLVLWELWYRKFASDSFKIMVGEIPQLASKSPANADVRKVISDCLRESPLQRPNIETVVSRLDKFTL